MTSPRGGTAASLSVVVDADTAAAESGLKSLSQSVSSFGDTFKAGLGVGAGIAAVTAGIGALATGFGALQGTVIGFNSKLEQSTIGFQSMLGSAEAASAFLRDLQQFAAKTPFAFPELVQASQRMLAYGFAAKEVRPLLTAVGNASAAMGAGAEGVDRITKALGQMRAATVVQKGELNQLTEVGVPAFEILARAIGKTEAQTIKLVEQGKISADVFIDAFQEWSKAKFGDMMEKQAKTFEGAMSTIQDVLQMTTANAFRPFFDALSAGAVQVSEFLSGENFQAWARAFEIAMQGAISWLGNLLSALAPVGEVIATAFRQFTSGDFAAAFGTISSAIQGAIQSAVSTVQAFAQQMFGAGITLISELAGGILSGASSVLMAAVDTVASVIASFLIGNSPPAEGPLSRIKEGGANVIAAWGEGAAEAADGAVRPVVDAIAGNLADLKNEGKEIDSAIRDVGRSLQDVEAASRDIKYAAEDIKTAYNDQISIIDDQIKGLQKAVDTQREREQLELSLEEVQLRQAEIAAMGDKELRSQIQARLAALKTSTEERKNREAIADAEKAAAGSEKDRLRSQLESQKMAQQEADLQDRLRKAKDPKERERIRQQLQELATRREIQAVEEKERQEAAARRLADANAKKEELTLQQQLSDMVDKDALAEIKARQAAIKSRQEELGLQEQAERIQREIAMGPLKEERERLIAERDGLVKPLEQQLQILGRQKDALTAQRQTMQGYKADIGAATAALKEQAAAAKESMGGPPGQKEKGYTGDAIAAEAAERVKAAGANLAGKLREGFVAWITANPILTGATLVGALLGAGRGAAIGAALGSVVPVIGTAIGGLIGAAIGAGLGGLGAGQFAGLLQTKIEAILGKPLLEAIQARLEPVVQTIRDAMATIAQVFGEGWEPSAAIDPFVNSVGMAALFIRDTLIPALEEAALSIWTWVNESLIPSLSALWEWLSPKLSEAITWLVQTGWPMLAKGGASVNTWIRESLIPSLIVAWEWLGPKLSASLTWLTETGWPTLLEAATEVWTWLNESFIPALGDLWGWLGETIPAAIDWLVNDGWPMLLEAGRAVAVWVMETFVPALIAIWEWLGPKLSAALTWLVETGWPTLQAAATTVWTWLNESLIPTLALLWDWIGPKLAAAFTWLTGTGWPALLTVGEQVSKMYERQIGLLAALFKELDKQGVLTDLVKTLTALAEILTRVAAGIATNITRGAMLLAGLVKLYVEGYQPLSNLLSTFNERTQASQRILEAIVTPISNVARGMRIAAEAVRDLMNQLDRLRSFQPPSFMSGGFNFGGVRADGGPVSSGMTYLVGERGPELFTPSSSGYVVPNHAMSASGTDADYLADRLAAKLGPVIAAARPVNLIGTVAELKRYVKEELGQEAAENRALWGVR